MITTLVLSSLAPIVIFITLTFFHSTTLTFICFYIGVCLGVPSVDLFLIKKMSFREATSIIGFFSFRKTLVFGILSGLFFGLSIYAFFAIYGHKLLDEQQLTVAFEQWNITRKITIFLVAMLIFINPVVEEIYWRGYIFSRLRSATTVWQSIIISSVFYTSYHLLTTGLLFSIRYGLFLSIFVFFAGGFWGYLRYATNSVFPTITSHLLADAGIMLVYLKYVMVYLPG